MPSLSSTCLSAAFQEKRIINDIAKIQIISDFSRQLLTNLYVFSLNLVPGYREHSFYQTTLTTKQQPKQQKIKLCMLLQLLFMLFYYCRL
jgi:hypothetical protein